MSDDKSHTALASFVNGFVWKGFLDTGLDAQATATLIDPWTIQVDFPDGRRLIISTLEETR
jgi:hypothetical protein